MPRVPESGEAERGGAMGGARAVKSASRVEAVLVLLGGSRDSRATAQQIPRHIQDALGIVCAFLSSPGPVADDPRSSILDPSGEACSAPVARRARRQGPETPIGMASCPTSRGNASLSNEKGSAERNECRNVVGTVARHRAQWRGPRGPVGELPCTVMRSPAHRAAPHRTASHRITEQNSACTGSWVHPVAPNRSWERAQVLRVGIEFPHPPHASETARVQGSSYANIHMSKRDSVAIWLGQFNASAQRLHIHAETPKR